MNTYRYMDTQYFYIRILIYSIQNTSLFCAWNGRMSSPCAWDGISFCLSALGLGIGGVTGAIITWKMLVGWQGYWDPATKFPVAKPFADDRRGGGITHTLGALEGVSLIKQPALNHQICQ